MWPHSVVRPSPTFNQHLRFQQRVEDFAIQEFVAKLTIKAFDVAVFPRRTRFDKQRFYLDPCKPFPHPRRGKLWTVIAANVIGYAATYEQIAQPFQDVLTREAPGDVDGQALAPPDATAAQLRTWQSVLPLLLTVPHRPVE